MVGSGIAGLVVADTLSRRGFEVTVREANHYAGGKAGAWKTQLPDGSEIFVDHGFHAFFRHYYNLDSVLERLGIRNQFVSIEDYMILDRQRRAWRFGGIDPTPGLNLLSLGRRGVFRWRDILFGVSKHYMDVFLRYDRSETYETLGDTDFATFAKRAELPPSLRLVFQTFARAFFADDDKLSTADIVKSFHFYFLSNDAGLVYDYPESNYSAGVIQPMIDAIEAAGGKVLFDAPVASIGIESGVPSVDGEVFDYVVLATDVVGTSSIVKASPTLAEASPALASCLSELRTSQRYAVLRLWVTGERKGDEYPVFVSTERDAVLDSITFYHRIDEDSRKWAAENQGGVYELHCYAVPEEWSEAEVRQGLLVEMAHYLGFVAEASIFHEVFEVRQNFTAYHVGTHRQRPGPDTGLPRFGIAGDWVDTGFPTMLLEAAATSGLQAANRILEAESLRTERVYSVPPRGLLAGLPAPPKPPWVDFGPREAGSR